MNKFLHQAIWYGRQCLNRLGLWGLIGVSLTVFTGVLLHLSVKTIQSPRVMSIQTSQVVQEKSLRSKQKDNPSTIDNKTNELLPILSILPNESSLPNILHQIYQQSKHANLNIASAEYKWRKLKKTAISKDGNLVQYEITFPLTGRYTSIRNMVNGVLADIPTLALETLEFQRESAESNVAQAKVTFVVFMLGDIE